MPLKKKINNLIEMQQAEIERLRLTNESLNEIIGDLLDDWSSAIEKAKSEAIKEVTAELYNSFRQYEKLERMIVSKEAELLEKPFKTDLSEFSTTQLKAELRRRKRERQG